MVIILVECDIKWLNSLPTENVISSTMIPDMIVQYKPNPDFKQKIIIFGSYATVYIGTNNTMKRRSVP